MTDFSLNVDSGAKNYGQYNLDSPEVNRELSLSNTWLDSSVAKSNATSSNGYINAASVVTLPAVNTNASTQKNPFESPPQTNASDATLLAGKVIGDVVGKLANEDISKETANQAIFYFNHPSLETPRETEDLLSPALSQALDALTETSTANSEALTSNARTTFQSANDKEIGRAYDQAFENIIKGKPNEAALREAHYMREEGTPLTAEEKQALEEVAKQFGIPTDGSYIPQTDKQGFVQSMNVKYNEAFEQALNNSSLSDGDKALVKHLYFNPSANVPANIKDALKSLNDSVKTQFTQSNSLPQNWVFTPASSMYNAGMNGYFSEYLQEEISAYVERNPTGPSGAPWTAEQKAALQNNPEIRQAAIDAVMARYGLQGIAWQPAAAGTFPSIGSTAMATIANATEIFSQATSLVNAMPEGPTKTSYMNILTQISRALESLKMALYEGQGATSEQMRQNSQAKLDMALASIKRQMAGSQEINKKQEKTAGMGIFSQIINAIMAFFLLLASVAIMNPVGVALATMMFIDTVSPETKCMDKMFKAIDKVVAAILPGISPQGLKFFQMAAKIAVIVAMLPAAGPVALQAGPAVLEKAGLMKDMIKMCGGTDEQAELGNTIFNVVVGAVVTIVMVVVGIVFTAGVGSGGAIANMIAKVTEASMQGAKAGIRALQIAAEVAQATITIASSACSLATAVIMRDIALLKANLKADKVLSDAEIDNMIRLINKLLQSLMGGSEFITALTQAQSHLHAKAIATSTAISSA